MKLRGTEAPLPTKAPPGDQGGLSTLGTNGGDERNRREQAQASASGLHQAYGWVVLLSTLPQFKLMLRGASRK
jgi:hypothetical protein